MPAFRDVIDVPLVVRRLHKSRKEVGWSTKHFINHWSSLESAQIFQITSVDPFVQVRKELGIAEDVNLVILNFGGQVWLFLLPFVLTLFLIDHA